MRQAVQEAFVEGLNASWYKYCHCEQCHTRRLAEEVLQVRGTRARARARGTHVVCCVVLRARDLKLRACVLTRPAPRRLPLQGVVAEAAAEHEREEAAAKAADARVRDAVEEAAEGMRARGEL